MIGLKFLVLVILQISFSNSQSNSCFDTIKPSVNCSLSRLFTTYGSLLEINFEGFEHLLEHVHAADYFFNHSISAHLDNASKTFISSHVTHDHNPPSNEENGDDDLFEELPEGCCSCSSLTGENALEHASHLHIERSRRRKKRETGEILTVTETKEKCYTPGEIMASVQLSTKDQITPQAFKDICPIILDQIDRGTCLTTPKSVKKKEEEHHEEDENGFSFPPLYVWLIALGAVFLISLLGFIIVAVLPLMYTVFYNHLQQYLVAMAVGTLSGDAILHLIPHAFFPHADEGDDHEKKGKDGHDGDQRQLIYFGTLILVGILLLYVIEQIINIFPRQMELKRLEKAKETSKLQYAAPRIYLSTSSYYVGEKLGNPHTHDSECCEDDEDDNSAIYSGQQSLRPGYRDYPERHRFCYPFYGSCNDIVFRLQSRSRNNLLAKSFSRPYSVNDTPSDSESINPETVRFVSATSENGDGNRLPVERSNTLPSNSLPRKEYLRRENSDVDSKQLENSEKEALPGLNDDRFARGHSHRHSYNKHDGHGHSHGHSHGPGGAQHHRHHHHRHHAGKSNGPDSHGHSHSHGLVSHDEEPPATENKEGHGHGHGHGQGDGSCTGTAMMVGFADVFHNFIDGMAIGAAFTQRLAGGLSTSIAVTLHELPHEMGDFALLLQEGLSIKKGLCLNALSSLVCLVGVALGVGLGSIPMFNQFIFSLAAGMFLYVSLVTMLPQVSSIHTKPNENPYRHLAYQLFGMLSGIGLMFLIAMYEERMQASIYALVVASGLTS